MAPNPPPAPTRAPRNAAEPLGSAAIVDQYWVSAEKLHATAGSVNEAIKKKKPLKIENFADHYNPATDIYRANLDKIGLLGELARDVVKAYELLAMARGDTRDAVKNQFNDEGEINPEGTDVENLWLAPAKKAEDLAKRLEAYEPPDD